MQKRHNLLGCAAFIFIPIYLYKYDASMLAVKCIYACYQMNLCLLSNESMLSVKDVLLLSKT